MTIQLRPSFIRCAFAVAVSLLFVSAIAYFLDRYQETNWPREYMLTLLIPFAIAPTLVWFMFVPKRLEFSETQFTIQFPFRPLHTLDWSDLEYYGAGENVFMIQFASIGTFQIFGQAFRRNDWRLLRNFLRSTFPDKRASGSIGDWMFKWPRRKP